MYLKSITLIGFKSFYEKTTLEFQRGITAIVGPNGCGKSNICDAIRWVLGEQSAKALRGETMADVIFNGSEERKPLSMAEVSLILGDVEKERLTAAGLPLEFNELMITRRVYRDGTGEYLINGTPCRLKDIQQLFLGTGIGRSSYSILAQGQVTQLISSRPEDRRMVFEEAAGISKYKAQRKEALRKLEYTEQNLLRLSDLIREVKRQIGSLQRQAGKARRYKQYSEELKFLETQYARHQYDCLLHELGEARNRVTQLQEKILQIEAAISEKERELSLRREDLKKIQEQLRMVHGEKTEISGQIQQHHDRILFNQRRLAEAQQRQERAQEEIARAQESLRNVGEEIAGLTAQREQLIKELQEREKQLAARQASLKEVEERIREQQRVVAGLQSKLFEQAQVVAQLRNRLSTAERQAGIDTARLNKAQEERDRLLGQKSQLEASLGEKVASLQGRDVELASVRSTAETLKREISELEARVRGLSEKIEKLTREQTEAGSRLGVLKQLEAAYEGYGQGTKAALQLKQFAVGVLVDHIKVPDRYVRAIEAALGHYLEVVLTEHAEGARAILTELKNQRVGRACIAMMDLCQRVIDSEAGVETVEETQSNDGFVPAISVIASEEKVRPLLKALLGRTLIVEDLDKALAGMNNGLAGHDFVTLSGELLTRHGVLIGGTPNHNGKNPVSLLARKNEIAALEARLAELAQERARVEQERESVRSQLLSGRAALEQVENRLRQVELEVASSQAELKAAQASLEALTQRLAAVEFEIETLRSNIEEALHEREATAAELQAAEQKAAELQQEFQLAKAKVEQLDQERNAVLGSVSEARVQLVTAKQQLETVEKQLKGLLERERELEGFIKHRFEEITGGRGVSEQAGLEIDQSKQAIERLSSRLHELDSHIGVLAEKQRELESAISELEQDLGELRNEWSQLKEELTAAEVLVAQKQLSADHIKDQIKQKYQVDLDQVRSECIRIIFADEGPAKVEIVSPQEMADHGLGTDWEAVSRQIAWLKNKLEEMGPVNLVAIEEFEAVQERYRFLTTQYEDLVQAKNQLVELINRINAQSRQLFLETFEQVRKNFRELFVEVFGGGKADLYLVDENDVLESGIEIVARPPGKQTQSISLLSGGEQTMTAVALLFAIYQVKPSPFCVLDELDAALDEANINRFVRLVQRYTGSTQFIIITHNKRTISLADVIYGVTMEEKGVSKLVSVKFQKSPLSDGDDDLVGVGGNDSVQTRELTEQSATTN